MSKVKLTRQFFMDHINDEGGYISLNAPINFFSNSIKKWGETKFNAAWISDDDHKIVTRYLQISDFGIWTLKETYDYETDELLSQKLTRDETEYTGRIGDSWDDTLCLHITDTMAHCLYIYSLLPNDVTPDDENFHTYIPLLSGDKADPYYVQIINPTYEHRDMEIPLFVNGAYITVEAIGDDHSFKYYLHTNNEAAVLELL